MIAFSTWRRPPMPPAASLWPDVVRASRRPLARAPQHEVLFFVPPLYAIKILPHPEEPARASSPGGVSKDALLLLQRASPLLRCVPVRPPLCSSYKDRKGTRLNSSH